MKQEFEGDDPEGLDKELADLDDDSDDDLEDFNKLKAKQEVKAAKQMTKTGVSSKM